MVRVMKVVKGNLPSRGYAAEITASHFGKAPKKKFCQKDFKDIVEGAHLSGRMDAITELGAKMQELMKENETLEVALGELQIMLRDCWNEFSKGAGRGKVTPMHDVDFLIEDKDPSRLIIQ